MDKTQIRQLAINLLDDENGINENAFNSLVALDAGLDCTDIWAAVQSVNGRRFLPEEHGLVP